MKKFISGFIIGAMLFSMLGVWAAVSYTAKPLDYKVMVNGKEFTSDPPPLEVDGRTYLPLRAMGDALGVPVNWNEELRQAEVGNSAPVANKNEYSRNNPAPLNTVQTYTSTNEYFEDDNYTVSVRVIETVRGNEAWKKIKAENQFNDPAPEGYEYIIAQIAFSVNNTNGDYAISASEYDFDVFTSNNEEIEQSSVVCPSPELSGQAYSGGNLQGNVVFTVKKDDANPKIVYGADYNGAGGIWFSLAE